MKLLKIILSFILISACTHKQGQSSSTNAPITKDSIIKPDSIIYPIIDWQQGFGLTHDPTVDSIWGKPVTFYIDNPNCSPIARDFYTGKFRPEDNPETAALLALVSTNDNTLRPFYRWCLNKTIQIQDGALSEYTGVPARQYAEKFPNEFFTYMDFDSTGAKYLDWVNAIMYSGFYDNDDDKNPLDLRKRLTQTMKVNCKDCNEQLKKRIEDFAMDCFP